MSVHSINALFYPEAVAVSGSVSEGKLGAVLLARLLDGGYKHVYAVNPKGISFHAAKGYASICDIPQKVDMVVIASPASTVASVMEDAGKAGVKAAVIISSGFSEAGNHALEDEVKAVALRYDIRYIGPNCAGMVNTAHNLVATLEASPAKGRVSLISQSGAVGGMVMEASRRGSLGIGKFASYGNGSDLSEVELLEYLIDDPDTDVIAMYLENVKHGRRFMQVLSEATHKKPVIAIKSGRTDSGRRAALSHTGSMAGADAVYEALFQKCGAVRVDSIEELIEVCKGFSMLPAPKGKRTAIITNSGGPGVLCIDKCDSLNLVADAPSEGIKAGLSQNLPAFAGLNNPIDVTVEGTAAQYGEATALCLREYDSAIVIYVGTPYLAALPVARAVCDAARRAGKPVFAAFSVGSDIDAAIAHFDANNVVHYASGERAANVLAHMMKVKDNSARLDVEGLQSEKLNLPYVLEPDAMELLSAQGIPVPKHAFVTSATAMPGAAEAIGYPLCMKIVSPQIIHKSDAGGVKLNIKNIDEAVAAFKTLQEIGGGKDFRGVMLYPMLKRGVEVILGLTRDAQLGPVVAFGLGGIYTEVLKDVAIRLAPLSYDEAVYMISSIRAYKLLSGTRGEAVKDIAALADALVKLSELMFKYENIAEVDLNPVFVYEHGIVTADARIIIAKGEDNDK